MGIQLSGTKARIIETAVRLFALHGYSNVSVRDIAGEVGIKDASIYSHFKSKEEILDTIIERFSGAFLESIPPADRFESLFECCTLPVFLEKGFTIFKKRLEDPVLAWTYLVLMREQFDEGRAAEAWAGHRETAVRYVESAFRELMAKGKIRKLDPEPLARAYEYGQFLIIERLIAARCRGQDTAGLEKELARQRQLFCEILMEKQDG